MDSALKVRDEIEGLRSKKSKEDAIEKSGQLRRSKYGVVFGDYSWHRARVICERAGGHLVHVESESEMRYLQSRYFNKMDTILWIGGSDYEDEGDWKWTDGRKIKTFWWAKGDLAYGAAPSNQFGFGHYLVMHKRKEGLVWNDVFESGTWMNKPKVQGFICEWD